MNTNGLLCDIVCDFIVRCCLFEMGCIYYEDVYRLHLSEMDAVSLQGLILTGAFVTGTKSL